MTQLLKSLSFIDAFSIVVGSMIGTGVFLKSATMAQLTGSPDFVVLAWIVAGFLSLLGAFSYSEMGRRYPKAGGEYVYLKESYGPLPAFLFGWTRFWIASTGSVAAYGVGAATFLSEAISLKPLGGNTAVAIFLIGFYTVTNCFAVSFGGKVQSLMTGIKILLILLLVGGLTVLSTESPALAISVADLGSRAPSLSAFGMAMISALWAFDGWNNLPMAAGEVKDSTRIVPLALVSGTLLVLGLYLAVNWSFFRALPFSEVVTSNSTLYPKAPSVAAKAASQILGERTTMIVSCLFVVSALGAMNGSILTGARVPYAMAKDGLFFSVFGRLNSKTKAPIVAVLFQGVWAMCLALSGSFDQITNYVIFASWIFYSAVAFAVFRMKLKFRIIPLCFSICGVGLLINTVLSYPKDTSIGLALISSGIPVFLWFKQKTIAHQK